MILLGVLAMAIGTTPPETYPVHGDSGHVCNAAKAGKLVGRSRSAKVGNEALRLSGARTLRWIAPGTMVTMDYREDRLNLRVDSAGRVVKVDCG